MSREREGEWVVTEVLRGEGRVDLRGVHMVLERSANGSANGGVTHEQTDRTEGPLLQWHRKRRLQWHHKRAQLDVLLGAV